MGKENKALITTREASDYLGIKTQTLADWRCKKKGPVYVNTGRIFYRLTDIDEWVERCRINPEMTEDD